jgi:hypothetical protein
MAQINPAVMDHVDFDQVAVELAKARGTPRSILRDPKMVGQMREERKQMEMMQQAAAIAEPASKSVKNLAVAQAQGAPA